MEPDRSGLVATPIIDRRGRQTTVHRKVEKQPTAPRRNTLPAPRQEKSLSNKAIKSALLKESLTNEHACDSLRCRSQTCMRGVNSVALINEVVRQDPRAQECLAAQIPAGLKLDESSVYIYEISRYGTQAVYSLMNEDGEVQDKFATTPISLNRTKMAERAARIDKNLVPSFKSMDELQQFVKDLYGDHKIDAVRLRISAKPQYRDGVAVEPVIIYSVSDLRVARDLRGLGIGRHIMDMITKFADESGVVLTLVPTEAGDHTFIEGEAGYEENRREHYFRIKRFYESCGFVESPFFRSELTFDNQREDEEAVRRLEREFIPSLEFSSMIREPHGGYPPQMFRH